MLECVVYTLGVGSPSVSATIATIAFGLGLDCPSIHKVVHISEIVPRQLALGVWLTTPEIC